MFLTSSFFQITITILFQLFDSFLTISMDVTRGIPRRCPCGASIIVLTSTTKLNPGKKFYRCSEISGSNHVWKWVDEAHEEEFANLAEIQASLVRDMAEIKADIEGLKTDIREIISLIQSISSKI